MSSQVEKKESKWVRAIYALPLLAVAYGAHKTLGVTVAQVLPALRASSKAGRVLMGNGESSILVKKYFGVKGFDDFIAAFVAFFTPALGGFDPAGRTQAIGFMGDLIPFQAIWIVEGIRRGNVYTVAHLLPTLLGVLFQLKGAGLIAPIYFFIHYVQSPLENYREPGTRLTQMGPVKTIIPTLTLVTIIPSLAMFFLPNLAHRQWINGFFFQPFPLWVALLQRILPLFVKDTTETDKVSNPEADMKYLRRTYIFVGIVAAAFNTYARMTSTVPLKDVFFKDLAITTTTTSMIDGVAKFLKWDLLLTFGSSSIWTLLHFMDLKKAGIVRAGWMKIFAILAGLTATVGPGAAMVTMWAWREEVLASRKKIESKKK